MGADAAAGTIVVRPERQNASLLDAGNRHRARKAMVPALELGWYATCNACLTSVFLSSSLGIQPHPGRNAGVFFGRGNTSQRRLVQPGIMSATRLPPHPTSPDFLSSL